MKESNQRNVLDSTLLSNFFCKLAVKGTPITPSNIKNLNIRESIFTIVPILELVFIDTGIFYDKSFLVEGDIVLVEISKDEKSEPPISMKFSINDFSIINTGGDSIDSALIRITAMPYSETLFLPQKTRCFKNKNSTEVIKDISVECGFKYIEKCKTSDLMNWYQSNQNNYSMICNTISRSYKQNDGMMCYLNRYNEFCLTSLNTCLNNKSSRKALFNPEYVAAKEFPNKDNNIFFSSFEYNNVSGTTNKELGNGISFSYYDGEKQVNKTIKDDNHSLTEFSNKSLANKNKIARNDTFSGTMLNSVFQNYHSAIQQNEYYLRSFFSNFIAINIANDEKVQLMDKINLVMPASTNDEKVNGSFSGNYLVGAIVHQISDQSNYRQKLYLFRDGYNKPSED